MPPSSPWPSQAGGSSASTSPLSSPPRPSSPAEDEIRLSMPGGGYFGRGLVSVVRREYQAPAGGLDFLHFYHAPCCPNSTFVANNYIRGVVNGTKVESWRDVEIAVSAAMASRGCEGCGLDKESSYGLYFRQHSQGESSFVPSQLTDSGSLVSTSVVSAPAPSMGELGAPGRPCNPQVQDSQPGDNGLPPSIDISSGERKLYRGFQLDCSSDEDYAPPAGRKTAVDRTNTVSSPPLPPRIGSGFNSQQLDGNCPAPPKVVPALPLSKRHQEFMVHTKERRGNTPTSRESSVPLLTTSQVVPSSAVVVYDTPMDLGAGANTEGTGIANSKYASQDAQMSSSLPPTSPIVSLPDTVPYTSSATTKAMLDGLRDIEHERNTPLVGSDDDMVDSDSSSSESSDDSAIDEMLKDYQDIRDVVHDLRFLYTSHKALKGVVRIMAEGLDVFKSTIRRLEDDCEELRLELHLMRGGHAFHTHVPTEKELDNLEKAKANAARVHFAPSSDSAPPPPSPPTQSIPHSSAKVQEPDAETFTKVDGGKKKNRRRRGNKLSEKEVMTNGDRVTTTDTASVSTPPNQCSVTGAAMYSQVLSGPPPVPRNTRPTTQGSAISSAKNTASQSNSPPRLMRIPTSTPTPNARERHITIRFAAGKNVQLPLTPEAIRIRLNQTLSNLGKVGGNTPYFREARPRLNIGCIFLTLAEYTATDIWSRLEKCRTMLLREYGPSGLTDFAFARDVEKLKVLVSGVPLAPTGRGSIWKTDDWVGDKAYDGLRNDLERSNPGVVTAGRPNVLGSIYAMRKNNATSCAIRFVLERNTSVDNVIGRGRIFLFGVERNVRIWEEHRAAPVCGKCLQVGHMQTLCGFPPRCRFCFGDHLSGGHMCRQLNCPAATGEACAHTVRRCLLCDRSDHYTGYNKCPTLAVTNPAPGTIPPRAATPIRADDTSKTGISDRSRNRVRRQNKRRPGTPLAETMVAAEISAARISEIIEIDHKERAKHNDGVALLTPLKTTRTEEGKKVADYENSTSSQSVQPASTRSTSSGGIQTADDNKDSGFVLGIVAPPRAPARTAKSILKRSASDSGLSSHVAV